jgi:hypothetical protein
MKIRKVKLQMEEACFLCPGLTRRDSSGKLMDHPRAGVECGGCGRHVHARSSSTHCVACGK